MSEVREFVGNDTHNLCTVLVLILAEKFVVEEENTSRVVGANAKQVWG
jgi:hypothetical protein